MTAEPSHMPAAVRELNAVSRIAARTVAEPVSSPTALDQRHRDTRDDETGKNGGPSTDSGDDVVAVLPKFDSGTCRGEATADTGCLTIAPCRKPGHFTSRVDAANLQRERREAAETQHHDGKQTCDGEGAFNSAEAAVAAYTRLVRARLMMLVSAVTIESPVTTL